MTELRTPQGYIDVRAIERQSRKTSFVGHGLAALVTGAAIATIAYFGITNRPDESVQPQAQASALEIQCDEITADNYQICPKPYVD